MNEESQAAGNMPDAKAVNEEHKPSGDKHHAYSVIILGIVAAVLTMPLFILLYKYIPSVEINLFEKAIRLDHIILFLVIFFAAYYLLKKFRTIVYFSMISGLVVLTITNFAGIYTLENLYHDYSEFLYDLSSNSLSSEFLTQDGAFAREEELRNAIDYDNPDLRNYAASIAVKHFDDQAYLSKKQKMGAVFQCIQRNLRTLEICF
ncbi:MAG: hypothetical protein IPM77_14895 [Crocinitomicaceae bacterium]|nr:hypothetical protein [Crocinitomicaceae bacterium]